MTQPLGSIIQIAYVVPDLEQALENWSRKKMTGPFFVVDSPEFLNPQYRGNPGGPDVSLALCFSGNLCVELIKQNCDTPSVYKELMDSNGGGFHHWGVSSEDIIADTELYEQQGYELAFSSAMPDETRFSYMDTVPQMGAMIELIETTDPMIDTFKLMEDAAKDWDGSDPIRRLG